MDYKNGKIYQILNTVNDDVYVGSTTQPLCKRLYKHKADAKVRDCNIHKSIREIGEDNFYIELIETCPCNSREELRAREGYYIRARGTLNKKIEGRTQREWVTENKEHIREQKQQYYKDNIEHKKQYYEDHKQHIIEQHKQHYEENKESILQRNKRYYEDNNKLINERLTCNICGCQVCRRGMTRHQKSKKCKSYVKPIENED